MREEGRGGGGGPFERMDHTQLIQGFSDQTTVYTRVQVEFFGRENGLKKSTSTYIRENMRHTYRITKKCQNSLQQAKLRS